MISVTSPITGQPQTGLTSPTYTVTVDTAPPVSPGKQVAVTALGGTQTGVTTHSVASPFTTNFTRPANLRVLGLPNPITGKLSPSSVPINRYKLITRKGVTVLAGQAYYPMVITTIIEVPAGADTADVPNVRAALSLHGGALVQQSANLGETITSGLL